MCINRLFIRWVLSGFCLVAGPLFALQSRIWAGDSEKRVEGTYSRELLGGVQVRDNAGKNCLVRFEDLSIADLNYLKYRISPKISIEVDHSFRQLPRTEWSREDDDNFVYTFDVSVQKKSKLPYRGDLTAELFVLGDERLVDDDSRLVLMSYKKAGFVFPEEEKAHFDFSLSGVTFSAYRAGWILVQSAVERGKTYRGYIAAVSDSEGQLIEVETDLKLDWMTDDLPNTVNKLRQFYQEHPGSAQSRHFNSSFKKLEPPRIPWFQRNPSE